MGLSLRLESLGVWCWILGSTVFGEGIRASGVGLRVRGSCLKVVEIKV
jgi:hypothetical protein